MKTGDLGEFSLHLSVIILYIVYLFNCLRFATGTEEGSFDIVYVLWVHTHALTLFADNIQ